MSATESNVVSLQERMAAWLAAHPEALLNQMQQHREIVADMQDELTRLRGENKKLHADKQRLFEEKLTLEAKLEEYECPKCHTHSDPIEEDHISTCRPADDPPDREVYEDR